MSMAADTGRLIAFACDPTAVPGSSGDAGDYTRLVERYLSDAAFRLMVDDFSEGVGCEVAHADTRAGVILRSQPDGPWAWPRRTSDLPWNKKFSNTGTAHTFERAARMVVIPALLAYIAPTAADLDDLLSDQTALMPDLTVGDLEAFIRDYARDREHALPDPTDQEPALWWQWLQTTDQAPTNTRIGRSGSSYIVYDVLQCLQQLGLLKKVSGSGESTIYRPRRRLLFHYRDLLISELFDALRDFADGRERAERAQGSED